MGGIKDEAKFKPKEYPVTRVTSFKHEDFDKFLDYIELMPKAAGFKIAPVTEAEPDGGVHFYFDAHGTGPESSGRIICRVIVWFVVDAVSEPYVIGPKLMERIQLFWDTLNLDKNIQESGFELQQGIGGTGYERKAKKSPTRFSFTFKYYSKVQREIEKEAKLKQADKEKRNLYNTIADAIKNDDRVRTQVERLIKGLK